VQLYELSNKHPFSFGQTATVHRDVYGGAEISTPDELAKFLARNGRDPHKLNREGGKTLAHLAADIEAGECWLEAKDNRVIRHVRSAAILLRVPWLELVYKEISRAYPQGKIELRPRHFTNRETLKAGEQPIAGTVRGLQEELSLWEQVPFASPRMVVGKGVSVETAQSEAYFGLLSERTTYWFVLDLPALPWPEKLIEYTDHCGTRITIRRFREAEKPGALPPHRHRTQRFQDSDRGEHRCLTAISSTTRLPSVSVASWKGSATSSTSGRSGKNLFAISAIESRSSWSAPSPSAKRS
jgi:hypothetical protein